jgi:hypothetical protein
MLKMQIDPAICMKTKESMTKCQRTSRTFAAIGRQWSDILDPKCAPKPSKGWTERVKQAAEKPVLPVILSSREGSAFEFSSNCGFFVACRLLRMTIPIGFSAASKARSERESCGAS